MDRSLDDMIVDRQQKGGNRGRRGGRQDNWPRDGVRKNTKEDSRELDKAWLHDRYEGDHYARRTREGRDRRNDRHPSPEERVLEASAKLRVDNLHYDLTEPDLRELFTRIGPITRVEILYDRSDRSRGIAYVTYETVRDADRAIREFDGANAYGQPIKLTLVPSAPAARNPFDTATRPGTSSRSLFDRIETPPVESARTRRGRSESPGGRRSELRTKPVPDHVDRYIPGETTRSRSPPPRRSRGGRRPGARREDGGGRRDRDGRAMVQGRPRKTQEELDAEMADYWGGPTENTGAVASNGDASAAAQKPVPVAADGDIDMIE